MTNERREEIIKGILADPGVINAHGRLQEDIWSAADALLTEEERETYSPDQAQEPWEKHWREWITILLEAEGRLINPTKNAMTWELSQIKENETREEAIKRLEAAGELVPGCPGCQKFYEHPQLLPFAPRHKASDRCESGKHPHCTCDTCF